MSDSLNLAGQWELTDQQLIPQQPVMLAAGYDLGSPVPVTNTIIGDLLDGDRVAGRRTGNRAVTLPIQVTADDRTTLSLLTDQVMNAVDAPTFELRWWPDGGLPLVWDCYRATSTIVWDQRLESGQGSPAYQRIINVTFSAYPYGRSTDRESITAAATTTVIDAFTTAPTGGALSTTRAHDGTQSALISVPWVVSKWGNYYGNDGSGHTPVSRTYSGASRFDISTSNSLTVWAWVSSTSTSEDFEFTLTLSSASGTQSYQVVYTNMPTQSWRQVSFPLKRITSKTGTFDPTLVTKYSLSFRDYRQFWATPAGGSTHSGTLSVWLDTMTINPNASTGTQTTDGALLTLSGIIGSAKSPASLQLDCPTASNGVLVHRPPIDADPACDILNALATSTDQTITIPQSAAGFSGTYTVVVACGARPSGTYSATFTQRTTSSNTSVGSQTVSTVNDGTGVHPYVVIGQVTLPLRALPNDQSNTTTTFTVRVQGPTGVGPTDLLLLDTRGVTAIVELSPNCRTVWIDEPDPRYGVGLVLGAAALSDRSGAYGLMDQVKLSGGPFSLMPGDNTILIHGNTGSPTLTASYAPRWQAERSAGVVVTQ